MNKTMYLNILNENLLQSTEKFGIGQALHYYQDSDPKRKVVIMQT